MTKARDIADFKFENIVDTGTEGTRVATGTTAQRGSTAGQLRFNTTTGLAEYYTGTAFKAIDAPPTVSSVGNTNITDAQISANYDLSILGSGFGSGATVKFIGNDGTEYNSPTVTVNSETSITARVPTSVTNANEPFDVKVTNVSGLANTLADAFNVDAKPAWQTASGTLATIDSDATGTHATVSATDPEGDTVSYSETGGTVLSTQNFSLDSSTGAISGDPVDVNTSTTHSFTLRATSGTNFTDRAFNIIVNPPPLDGTTQARANTSAINILSVNGSSTDGYYWLDLDGTPRQFYCDMTNGGFILFSHWSPDTSNAGSPTVGSTSYADSVGGYSGVTTTAVAQPNTSDNITTASKWVWSSTTRNTNTGGSWFRNESNTGGGQKSYMPNNYGYSWTNCKMGLRISIPGGNTPEANSSNYNSVDGFTGAGGIDTFFVDGVSISTGGVSSRNHVWTYSAQDTTQATLGGAGGSAPGFVGSNYTYIQSQSGTSTSAYQDVTNTFSVSATSTPPEIRIISDQETANEDNYVRAFYIFLK